MSGLIWALLAVVLLPYLARIPVARAMNQLGGYDNHLPREQQAKLQGLGARANAAHYNSFEALQLFLAAFAACVASGNTDSSMQLLAWLYVACRVGFIVCYLADWALARSTVWMIGVIAVMSMIVRAGLSVS
ncbi:MAG TPA: hypothetical protein DCS87_09790 [Rheinheimera sp.]|nr:hypothetical protein [Rheinheimera sp.]